VQLGQLQKIEGELLELGFRIIAISPDSPDSLRTSIEKAGLSYSLVSDRGMEAARGFGLAYRVAEATADAYAKSGIELARVPGEAQPLLPVPAVFLVRTDGTISFSYANPDYKVRLDPELLLSAARLQAK